MDKTAFDELLIFMVTSAAGLPGEPKYYGSLRLIDAASRLAGLLKESFPEDEAYQTIIDTIAAGRDLSMTDPDGFNAMLQEAAAASVDLM